MAEKVTLIRPNLPTGQLEWADRVIDGRKFPRAARLISMELSRRYAENRDRDKLRIPERRAA